MKQVFFQSEGGLERKWIIGKKVCGEEYVFFKVLTP